MTEQTLEEGIVRGEEFLVKHGKKLLGIVAAVFVVVGGWMAYKNLYLAKRGEKAGAMMYVAQQNMAAGMWDAALNGDGNNAGFIEVAGKYGNTAQGNIAKHCAGVCYLKLGQFDEALDYLGRYRAVGGVPGAIVDAQNLGLQGDIFVEKGDYEKAVELFSKAVKGGDSFTAPLYLKKMGLALVAAGRAPEAVEAYQRILDEFPASTEAQLAEKLIGAAGQS